jgi:hypothetical protein
MHEADKALSVRFWLHATENPRKSKEAGRPIYDEVEMVSIMAPGNTKTEYTARADSMHYDSNVSRQHTYAERFPEAYEAFKRGIDDHVSGTPLSEVPFLTVGQKAEMRAKKIHTVEQLAAMSDRDIRASGMGFRQYVDMAKAYLDTAKGTTELADELAALRAKVAAMEGQAEPVEAEADEPSQFASMAEEDLRNMLSDAGVAVDGRWGKPRLVKEAEALAAKATEAA